MKSYRGNARFELEKQIKAYADAQTPDLFDRLSEWEDRAEEPVVIPLPRRRYTARIASLAACFVLLCGGLFVYLNRPDTSSLIAAQDMNQAEDIVEDIAEDDEAIDDCLDEAILEDDQDSGIPEPQDDVFLEDEESAPLEQPEPTALPEAAAPAAGGETEPQNDDAALEPPTTGTGGLVPRAAAGNEQEAAASSAESGEDSAEITPERSVRTEGDATAEPVRTETTDQTPASQQASKTTDEPAPLSDDTTVTEEAPDLPVEGESSEDSPVETAEAEDAPDNAAAAQNEDGGVMALSSAGEDQEAALPESDALSGEQLVGETNILRSIEVFPSQFTAQMFSAAPQAAEAPVFSEDGAAALGGMPDAQTPPAAQTPPDPAKELETVLLETGAPHLVPTWLPEGFVLEKAYTVSGDEPEDAKTGVVVYAVAPPEKKPEETADGAEKKTENAETALPPEGPPKPSLTISVKAQAQKQTVPAGEKWTVLAPGLEVLLHHETLLEGDTVIRDEFTALLTRDGYFYMVKGLAMEEESFLKAVRSIFETVES